MPKTNISGQIVSEILAQLCSDDSRSHHFYDVITLELYWQLFLTCLAKKKKTNVWQVHEELMTSHEEDRKLVFAI